MKTITTLFMLVLFCLSNTLDAQAPPPPNGEDEHHLFERHVRNPEARKRVQAARRDFLIKELNLTAVEADAFFPLLYNKEKEKRALRKKGFNNLRPMSEDTNMTEAEALKHLEAQIAREEALLQLHRESMKELLTVIPASKLIRLKQADQRFRRKLVDRIRKRRRERH